MKSLALICGLGIVSTVATLAGFCLGFIQLGRLLNPTFVGLLFGVGSALTWGWASLGLAGFLNATAALFAAISLGYLASADTVCVGHYERNRQQFLGVWGASAVQGLCYLRVSYHQP